ncbi:MAG: hypothetical protein HUK24_06170, partial [Sphaerochaetaceae bacterium]|nr:hypothetical protein [Sphaerochaetaceae bacterium]
NIVLADTQLITTSNIDKYIIAKLASDAAGLNVKEISLVEILVSSLIAPNILYDEPLTLQRKDAAENAVDTVVVAIEKGDLLIEDKHVITHEQKRILGLLSSQSNNFSIIETLGFVIFDTFIIGVGLNVFGFFMGRKNLHYVEYLVLLTVGLIISIIATYFLTIVSSRLNIQFTDSFIPLFFLPLFVTELSGKKRLGFVALFIYSSIIATLPNANIMSFFYCLTCGAASILLVRFFNRRIDVVYHWFFSCITCSGLSFTYMIIEQVTFNSIFTVLLGTILNVSISSILLSLSIPVVEKVFNLPTIFRLYELAYGENPILTRLSQAAPGTYSHSLAVADLAEAGARAIGANP